jgi:unsaturated rhamnogalacturonyl hydrolase
MQNPGCRKNGRSIGPGLQGGSANSIVNFQLEEKQPASPTGFCMRVCRATGRHAPPILINRICDRIDSCYRRFSTMPNFIAQIFKRRLAHLLLAVILLASGLPLGAQSWSQRAANTAIALWPNAPYQQLENAPLQGSGVALLLNGVNAESYNTANGTYFRYEKQKVDTFLATESSADLHTRIAFARPILLAGRVTQDARYFKAADLLDHSLSARSQARVLQTDPAEIYESAPFYAEYAQVFRRPVDFSKIRRVFSEDARGKKAGIGRADRASVASARDMGWYIAALVDTLAYYPHDDRDRRLLLQILNGTMSRVVRAQDQRSGLWHESLEKPGGMDDAVATCLITYALQKAVRLGYLRNGYSENATQAWRAMLEHFVKPDGDAAVSFIISVDSRESRGLRGADGERELAGAFLLTSTEMEHAPEATLARGRLVMLDSWFNSQQRTNSAGQKEYFHYKWGDYSDSGYSLFGNMFTDFGADLATLSVAPTFDTLKGAQYYVIVSPDIPAKNPNPHYVQAKDADQVAEWVRRGGVLILMENDPPNADIEHLNLIADRFGIHFNSVLSHHVIGDNFAAGQIAVKGGGLIFRDSHTLYMKDTCTLSLNSPAKPLFEDRGDVVIAMSKFGKGTVVAVVDPWLYNEYTDGRKKPPMQDNYAAGQEFVRWIISQRHADVSESARR